MQGAGTADMLRRLAAGGAAGLCACTLVRLCCVPAVLMRQCAPLTPASQEDMTQRHWTRCELGVWRELQAYPLDLVRTRLSAQTKTQYYTGIVHAMRTIVRDEGARGLYRGLGATLLQVTPSLAINYTAYGTLRSHWLQAHGDSSHTVLSLP